MLSINDVCKKTGITLHTFQYWRRNDSKLLPKPIAVEKRTIYFDDSILDRIQFIRDQQAAGKSLGEINCLFESGAEFAATGDLERKSDSLADLLGKLIGYDADLKIILDKHLEAVKKDLADHEQRVKELLRNFQQQSAGSE